MGMVLGNCHGPCLLGSNHRGILVAAMTDMELWEKLAVDELVNKLAKPIMVLRFANADTRPNAGAGKRADNARKEIDRLVKEYASRTQTPLTELFKREK